MDHPEFFSTVYHKDVKILQAYGELDKCDEEQIHTPSNVFQLHRYQMQNRILQGNLLEQRVSVL